MPRGRTFTRLRVLGVLAAGILTACGLAGVGSAGSDEDPSVPSNEGGSSLSGDTGTSASDDGGEIALDATVLKEAAADVPVETVTVDASPDAPGGCPPGSYRCLATETCVTDCAVCKSGPVGCGTKKQCVPSCGACPGNTFECYACAKGTSNPIPARCTNGPGGPGGCYSPTAVHCTDCKQNGCDGPEQSCIHVHGPDYECRGCGEPSTNGASCAGGGNCVAATSQCP